MARKPKAAGEEPAGFIEVPAEAVKEVEKIKEDSPEVILQAWLRKPFAPEDYVLRVLATTDRRALVIPELNAHCVYDRLDEVFGVGGWTARVSFVGGVFICTITVTVNGDEAQKTAAHGSSDVAFMDAAAMFGIGRYMRKFHPQWTDYDVSTGRPKRPEFVAAGVYWNGGVPKDPLPSGNPAALAAAATAKEILKPQPEKAAEKSTPAPSNNGNGGNTEAMRLKVWNVKMAGMTGPEDLNKALRTDFANEANSFKAAIWALIQTQAKDVGWVYDTQKKEYYDPNRQEEDKEPEPGVHW